MTEVRNTDSHPNENYLKKKHDEEKSAELSEEDKQLIEQLNLYVERLKDSDVQLHQPALEGLRDCIRTATSSMTSVPKPLKFLKEKFILLKNIHSNMEKNQSRNLLSDILSVLCMTYGNPTDRDTLKYRLVGSAEPPSSWGHEYVRHLTMEIVAEYSDNLQKNAPTDYLISFCREIMNFYLDHNAEAEACDLAMEMDLLEDLVKISHESNYQRIALYLSNSSYYETCSDDIKLLRTVYQIYRKMNNFPKSLIVALKLNDRRLIEDTYYSCPDLDVKKQLAFLMARQRISISEESNEKLFEIINNGHLSEQFISIAKQFEVLEPKTPEDAYKSHLENIRNPSLVPIDSAKQNLASAFVNAFLNVGYGKDKLVMTDEESKSSIYTTKDYGLVTSVASLGIIKLWDLDVALSYLDKYLSTNDDNVKAGALMAIGIVSSGVNNEADPVIAILSEYIGHANFHIRASVIIGLGIAYSGTAKEAIFDLLLPIINDEAESTSIELLSLACLSLGLVFSGTCHGEISSSIIQLMMEKDEVSLKNPFSRFMALGLAFIYLNKQESSDAILETLKVIENPIGRQAFALVRACSYATTGSVHTIGECMRQCYDHIDPSKESSLHQVFSLLGVSLIALGEDIGSEMTPRLLSHFMHYSEPSLRQTVPLALALLYPSHPKTSVLDALSKYSHDYDIVVAMNSIFSLGIVGAGTKNARVDQMLRQLAAYYHRESDAMFIIRIAQGLVHMGKGLISISPIHTDRFLISPAALTGLLTTLVAFTATKEIILGKYPYFLYFLVTAIFPRFLITLDTEYKPVVVSVRVGQAVETVGQAGRPKTITGFQTVCTPAILSYSERAELATEQYIPLTTVLEGFVIVKENPDYMEQST